MSDVPFKKTIRQTTAFCGVRIDLADKEWLMQRKVSMSKLVRHLVSQYVAEKRALENLQEARTEENQQGEPKQ